jgi:hypothetical protein
MYRSYYICVEKSCDAEIIVNDLKGGFLKIVREHKSFCRNNYADTIVSMRQKKRV